MNWKNSKILGSTGLLGKNINLSMTSYRENKVKQLYGVCMMLLSLLRGYSLILCTEIVRGFENRISPFSGKDSHFVYVKLNCSFCPLMADSNASFASSVTNNLDA